jgi:Flp pilus assembly pilin Flp
MKLMHDNSNRMVQPGNGATEYTIIGALIAVACAAGLMGLGNSINGQFMGMLPKSEQPKLAVASVNQSDSSLSDSMDATTLNAATPMTPLARSVEVANPTQVVETIQVAGVNGATQELLASLENRIRTLKASGEISEEQFNMLMQLANKGHDLAASQKALEDALAQDSSSVLYNGKTYKLNEFIGMLGFSNSVSQKDVWDLNPDDTSSPVLKPFAEAYQQVKDSGTFLDPNTKQQVSELVLQISSMDDALNWALDDVIDERGSSSLSQNYKQIMSDTIKNFKANTEGAPISEPIEAVPDASTFTNKNSAKICSTGGGKDKGKKCSD